MSLEFFPLTVQYQVLPERFVYVPQGIAFSVTLCLVCLLLLLDLVKGS